MEKEKQEPLCHIETGFESRSDEESSGSSHRPGVIMKMMKTRHDEIIMLEFQQMRSWASSYW